MTSFVAAHDGAALSAVAASLRCCWQRGNRPRSPPGSHDRRRASTILTYFSADLGEKALAPRSSSSSPPRPASRSTSPIDHENFKTAILVQLAGNNPPDAHTDWAGARTAFQVKNGSLSPIDDMWAANNLDAAFPAGVVAAARRTTAPSTSCRSATTTPACSSTPRSWRPPGRDPHDVG